MKSKTVTRLLNQIKIEQQYKLIYTAVIAFGFVVVQEVIDLVNSCSDLEGLYNSFDHLGMTSHKQCLEMLFL